MAEITIKGKVVKTIYEKGSYRILACEPTEKGADVQLNKYGNITLKGDLSYIIPHKEYTFVIKPTESSQYGLSYDVIDATLTNATAGKILTPEENYHVLYDICTPDIANAIFEAYPNYVQLVLAGQEDEIDLSKIYNVGEVRHRNYIKTIQERYIYYQIIFDNKQYDITSNDCQKLLTMYKIPSEIQKAIASNPYKVLIEDSDRSFNKVDDIILKSAPYLRVSEIRCKYAIDEILRRNEYEGSTYMDANTMAEYVVGIDEDLLPFIRPLCEKNDYIHYDNTLKRVARSATYYSEMQIAKWIKAKSKEKLPYDIDWAKYREQEGFSLTDNQLKLLEYVCKYNLMLLVGNAGSGKSSTVSALINMLEDNDLTYRLIAPTGKAANNLAQITHRDASTMHRAVLDTQLIEDVIIIDEFSFFGTEWANMLFTAIPIMDYPSSKIVIIGDDAQLNPINHGKVLNDLIESNCIPIIRLNEIFRYGEGGIYKVATDIRNGKPILMSNEAIKMGSDWRFVPSLSPLDTFIDEYRKALDLGLKPEQIMGLVPYNIGDCGTYILNNHIQEIVNPVDEWDDTVSYSINKNTTLTLHQGDYVINTVNNYKAIKYEAWKWRSELTPSERPPYNNNEITQVFNGDCGKVLRVSKDNTGATVLILQFNEEMVVYDRDDFIKLKLAYVISTHKAQGSSSPYVINISSYKHEKMLNRNLLYVANTRAKEQHIEIGNYEAINAAIDISENDTRHTWLLDMLNNI